MAAAGGQQQARRSPWRVLLDLSLQIKIIGAFLLVVAVLAGASVYQLRSVQYFTGLFTDMMENDIQRLDIVDDINLSSVHLRDQAFEYRQRIAEGSKIDFTKEKMDHQATVAEITAAVHKYEQLAAADSAHADPDNNGDEAVLVAATTALAGRSLDALEAIHTNQRSAIFPKAQNDALAAAYVRVENIVAKITGEEKQTIAALEIEVAGLIAQLKIIIVLMAILGAVMALLLGLLVSGWIARELARIKKGSQRIANGDFSRPIPVASHDEVGQLAEAFNTMAERLKDAYRRQAIAQRRDEAIMLSMGEGLIAVDAQDKVVFINQVACRLLEIPGETVAVGRPVQELYKLYAQEESAAEPFPAEQYPSYVAMQTGAVASDAFRFMRQDGNKLIINITATPVKLDGVVTGAVAVVRDITHEREVDRMKTEFISLASHQLRTPLSAIKWFSEMLVSGDAGELQPEQVEFARNIAESTERMIDLVNALLNISRIESGRIMVDPRPTELKELVSNIVNDLKAKIEERQHSLVISVHDDLPKINLDPRLIGQVYMNLLTNAIKYTPKGGEISVFVSRKGDEIISQITDNGYGIPKEQQARLFQKFFRATNAVKVETDGTGLGLYLIKAIIESSGGKIWFESEEGKGTTFWFSMPMSGMKHKDGEVTLDG